MVHLIIIENKMTKFQMTLSMQVNMFPKTDMNMMEMKVRMRMLMRKKMKRMNDSLHLWLFHFKT